MGLLIVYIGLVVLGDAVAYFIGLSVERYWPIASLPTFLFLYFFFLWVAWMIAVKVTTPRPTAAGTAAAG